MCAVVGAQTVEFVSAGALVCAVSGFSEVDRRTHPPTHPRPQLNVCLDNLESFSEEQQMEIVEIVRKP
jgi:hypothetical protein